MIESKDKGKRVSLGLGILQVYVSIGAIPEGIAMITDPRGSSLGMSIDWLSKSPFSNFFIPGIFLLVVTGLGSLLGGVFSFKRHYKAGEIAVGLGIFLIVWIILHFWWPGLHWLHIIYFTIGMIELILGLMLQKKLGIVN
jgi:hypothetical protein